MDVLKRVRCSTFQASLIKVDNLIFPVVRRAPVIMASPFQQRSPMTAGALRVWGKFTALSVQFAYHAQGGH